MKITEKDLEDFMVRAANHAHLKSEDLIKLNEEKGLVAVYDLGLKHMLEYLQSRGIPTSTK